MSQQFELLGRGLYSPPEASRLTRVPIRRINRWTRGYWYMDRGKKEWSGPIVGGGAERLGDAPFLVFADLIEIRCLSILRDSQIGWKTIRLASLRGKSVLDTEHPFSSDRFKLVGRQLLAEVNDTAGDRQLVDLVRDQWVFDKLVIETLRKGVHYAGNDRPQWWSPLGDDRTVVVHPSRAFGAPVVIPGGIRTRVLYGAYRAEESHESVARWYNVTVEAVKDAVEFEVSIRQAA
jgi:uncharacterized protein (DUF433 family)